MRLYSYWRSSASYRVRIALAIKGVSYEYTPINIAREVSAQDEAGYGAINPMHQVPVLEWREGEDMLVRLTQSVAIIEYLDERFPDPPLFARDPLMRAHQREAVEIVNAGIQPLHNTKTLNALRDAGGQELEERFRSEVIARGLRVMEVLAQAHDGPLFMGATASVVDVFIVPLLYSARRFAVDVSPMPRLLSIERHALAQDAFRAAHPDRQPDAAGRERSAP